VAKKKRGGSGKRKGGTFEREMCVALSKWWSNGKRDDIFWRSASSGGRATQRKSKGKTTANSSGDICALDPIGKPLLDLVSIELKRGYTTSIADLLDRPKNKNLHPPLIEQWIEQASGTDAPFWIIINQRNRKEKYVIMPDMLFHWLGHRLDKAMKKPMPMIRCTFKSRKGKRYSIVVLKFAWFKKQVTPKTIKHILQDL
jgi:hypothetical protein